MSRYLTTYPTIDRMNDVGEELRVVSYDRVDEENPAVVR